MKDLILRTQSELNDVKIRGAKLARMWEERKHTPGNPRTDRATVLMEVAEDAALTAAVIQEIKMALDAKEFIDLLVKFRCVDAGDDEGAARDFLMRQPKDRVTEAAQRHFNVFEAAVGPYGTVFLLRNGRQSRVSGSRLVGFVKWFIDQLLLEKESAEVAQIPHATPGPRIAKALEDALEKVSGEAVTISTKPMVLVDGNGEVLATVTADVYDPIVDDEQ